MLTRAAPRNGIPLRRPRVLRQQWRPALTFRRASARRTCPHPLSAASTSPSHRPWTTARCGRPTVEGRSRRRACPQTNVERYARRSVPGGTSPFFSKFQIVGGSFGTLSGGGTLTGGGCCLGWSVILAKRLALRRRQTQPPRRLARSRPAPAAPRDGSRPPCSPDVGRETHRRA